MGEVVAVAAGVAAGSAGMLAAAAGSFVADVGAGVTGTGAGAGDMGCWATVCDPPRSAAILLIVLRYSHATNFLNSGWVAHAPFTPAPTNSRATAPICQPLPLRGPSGSRPANE